jgi:hypothetical protein
MFFTSITETVVDTIAINKIDFEPFESMKKRLFCKISNPVSTGFAHRGMVHPTLIILF